MKNEPVLTHAAAASAATIIVTVAAAFGLSLDAAQVATILVVLAPVANLAAAYVARSKVRPLTDIEKAVAKLPAAK